MTDLRNTFTLFRMVPGASLPFAQEEKASDRTRRSLMAVTPHGLGAADRDTVQSCFSPPRFCR
jgi:hypothetical protein